MKKFLAFLLCVGFAFAFTACGGNSSSGATEQSGEQSSNSSSNGSNNEEETSFFTFTAEYDYGFHIKGKPYMLYSFYSPFFDVPSEHGAVVAGDVFTIEHTGALIRNDKYPGEAYLADGGEIVSVTAQKAETVGLVYTADENGKIAFRLYDGGAIRGEVKVANRPEYYLTNENGEIGYEELSGLGTYTVLYGTYSPVNGYDETDGYRLLGLYAWNPREG